MIDDDASPTVPLGIVGLELPPHRAGGRAFPQSTGSPSRPGALRTLAAGGLLVVVLIGLVMGVVVAL